MNSILFADDSLLQLDIHFAPSAMFSDRITNRGYTPDVLDDRFHQNPEITHFPYQYGMIKRSLDYFEIDIKSLHQDVIWVKHHANDNFTPMDSSMEALALAELKDLGFNVVVFPSDVLTDFKIYDGPVFSNN
jgi:hypothetical protein